ncbi:hypothetical protein COB11_05300 [Candidatus Aerophobetes bacterium]|uniref:Lipoprotein n=1 Tax=Aerophobetes bacterium TaxID=2030807 RepID=A0A2A4YF04_UNCAE|nr:MAG: hypothetical protein COB11_05300 [Candidatus Aerophobetes bacterium]
MNYRKLTTTGLFVLLLSGAFADCKCGCATTKENIAMQAEKKLYMIQEKIVEELKAHSGDLEKIQSLEMDIIGKWKHFLGVILPIQISVIKENGYEATQEGLSKFNREYADLSESLENFKKLNQEKWAHIFEKGFGNIKSKIVPMEKLESIANEICETVTSDKFLDKVQEKMNNLPVESTMLEKRQALLEVLFKMKLEILSKSELDGDDGYVQYSKAMIEHFHDSDLKKKMFDAYDKLMKSAKLVR